MVLGAGTLQRQPVGMHTVLPLRPTLAVGEMHKTSKLSKGERDFVLSGVRQNVREDGRGRFELRPVLIETGFLIHVHGSARLTNNLLNTDIIASVKADFSQPAKETPNHGKISVGVKTMNEYTLENKNLDNSLTNKTTILGEMLQRIFSDPAFLKTLCILPSHHCWLLNIDVLIVSSSGSLFDNLVEVIHAALHSVVLPKVSVLNGDGGEKILDMSNDPTANTYLDTTMLPLCCTLWMLGGVPITDTTLKEEMCSDSSISICMDRNHQVCGMYKLGLNGVDPKLFKLCISATQNIINSVFQTFDKVLENEKASKPRRDIQTEEENSVAGWNA